MNRKEELWRKLKIEIPVHRESSKLKRASTQTQNVPPLLLNQILTHGPSQEASSPTFKRQLSLKSDINGHQIEDFSFGQKVFHELNFAFNQQQYSKNSQSFQRSLSDFCSSPILPKDKSFYSKTALRKITKKLLLHIFQTKNMLDQLKQRVKNYQQNTKSDAVFQKNYIKRIVQKLQNKYIDEKLQFEQKLKQLNEQIYYKQEKQKILQKKVASLEFKISELSQIINKQRNYTTYISSKLNNQIKIKQQQSQKILQQNTKLIQDLKIIQQQKNELKLFINQIKNKGQLQFLFKDQFERLQNEKNKENLIFNRSSRKSSTNSINYLSPQASFDIKQSQTTSGQRNAERLFNSPLSRRYSRQSSRNFLNTQASQRQKLSDSPIQNVSKYNTHLCIVQPTKIRRNSTIQIFSTPKNYQINIPQSRFIDKNEIMSRIKKLKQNIKTDLEDMKINSP